MPRFTVTELGVANLAAAWPLARTAGHLTELRQWLEFAKSLMSRGGGIVGVAVEEKRFLGVATYEPVVSLHAGNVLRVEILVAFELTRQAPVRAVLSDALDRLALTLGCDSVAVRVPNRSYLAQARKQAEFIPRWRQVRK